MLPRILPAVATAAIIGAAAAAFPAWMWWTPLHGGLLSGDLYGFIIPNFIYARDSLSLGQGIFWNPFQNCGQPFFADIQSVLLYPFNVLFFLLDPMAALLGMVTLNLLAAGAGTYLLARSLGLNRPGSLCAALTFQLSVVTYGLTVWMPTTALGPYVWIPAALLCTERILRRPTAAGGVVLAVVLAVQFLGGLPQTSLFTYQLIALRLLWDLARRGCPQRLAKIGAVALALVLGLGLSAVQLVPSAEFASLSIRSVSLGARDVVFGNLGWRAFLDQVLRREGVHPFAMVPCLLAAVAVIGGRQRRVRLFYLAAALTYSALVFPPLRDLYLMMPFIGSLFRDPSRFFWVTCFALSIPVGYGAHLLTQPPATEQPRERWRVVGAALTAVAAWLSVTSSWPTPAEWAMLLGVAAAALAAGGRARPVAVAVLPIVLAWNHFSTLPHESGLRETAEYYGRASLLRSLAEAAGPQQRLNLMAVETDLMVKTASVLRIPTTRDYQPQTSRRYAELLVRMNRDRRYPLESNNVFIFFEGQPPTNRPLANLTALRFIVSQGGAPRLLQHLRRLYVEREQRDAATIFENPTVLPRAYYVPRLEVVGSPEEVLDRLASKEHDPRRTVLVERAPADGFLGSAEGMPAAAVERFEDGAETLQVDLRAEESGFLFVADQYYPGWEATVNGAPVEVLQANYVFRAVRVPAGESTVVFRYRPRSIRLGASISAVCLLVAVALLLRARTTARASERTTEAANLIRPAG